MNAGQQHRQLQTTVPALYLQYLPPDLIDRARDFFVYGVDFAALAGGTSQTGNIAIQDDSHFLMVAAVGVANSADAETFVATPAVTAQIEDTGAGRNLFNRPQHWGNIFGTAQLPAYWPYPKLIARGSLISTTLNNLGATALTSVRIGYLGFKIFQSKRGT